MRRQNKSGGVFEVNCFQQMSQCKKTIYHQIFSYYKSGTNTRHQITSKNIAHSSRHETKERKSIQKQPCYRQKIRYRIKPQILITILTQSSKFDNWELNKLSPKFWLGHLNLRNNVKHRNTHQKSGFWQLWKSVKVQCCFASIETMRTIGDGEPRTSTSTFTQLLSSVWNL